MYFHVLPIQQSTTICSHNFSSLLDKYSTLPYSNLHTNVLTEFMHSLYQGVYLVLTFGKQFQVIHKQQVIQFEPLAVPFIASLSSSQEPCQWDHTQNKQQWR